MQAGLTIPDQSTSLIGFDVDFTNIQRGSFVIGGGDMTFGNPGINKELDGLGAACTLNWDYKLKIWPHIPRGSGTADINMGSTTLGAGIDLGVTDLRPVVTAANANVNIGSFDIDFHGGITPLCSDRDDEGTQ